MVKLSVRLVLLLVLTLKLVITGDISLDDELKLAKNSPVT